MNNWKYKYSFYSGILYLISIILRVNSTSISESFGYDTIYSIFAFSIISFIGLMLGYIKYGAENNKLFKFSSLAVLVSYIVLIILASLTTSNIFQLSESLIIFSNLIIGITYIIFGISTIKIKTIFNRKSIYLGVFLIIFGFLYLTIILIPLVVLFNYILFIALIVYMKE